MNKKIRKKVISLSKRKSGLVDEKGFDSEFILNHLIEEMAELMQAINKARRTGWNDQKRIENLYEETADVYIGIHELIHLLADRSLLESYVKRKVSTKTKYLDKWESKVSQELRSHRTA